MRRKGIRRALAALGTFAVVAGVLAAGSSPAGADVPGWAWHYPEANCVSSVIEFTVGSMFIGNEATSGGSTYRIRAFCPASGYEPGEKVWDPYDGNQPVGESNRWEYQMPSYDGPDRENIPGLDVEGVSGPAGDADGDADRAKQYAEYVADLKALGDRIYQDLGSPTPANIEQFWAATEAAANAQREVDRINASFSQLIPTEAVANINWTCHPWFGCWNPRFNGLAKLRNMTPETPMQNWFWMNNWYLSYGNLNGNISSSWATPGWTSTEVGTGGVLTGCLGSATGLATGTADASVTHQLWHGTALFGCGIGGGNAEGGAAFLGGVRAEYKVDWMGGQPNT